MTRLVIILFVLLAQPVSALACSCMDPPPPLEALAGAAAVFTGEVIGAVPDGANGYTYTMRVHAVWKGPATPQVEVATSDVAMCGLMMPAGAEYLVYAYDESGALYTHNCSRSAPVEFATIDLAELGEPMAVEYTGPSMAMLKARYH